MPEQNSKPTEFIDVVFDGPPSHESGRFIEVEDPNGWSVNAGEWIDRGDGTWALRISPESTARALYPMPRAKGWYLDKDGVPIHVDGDRYNRVGQHANNDFHYREFAPFTMLRPVPQSAAEVLADVRNMIGGPNSGALLHAEVDKIAAKYGVTQ
ncbi:MULTISPECIES: hypothetical protein [unclassified Cryobacterium]|uniref:hypothetical protein n=1 Tax=unclassified Cryobacterium TaxID=2649013 RepID=UPI00106BC2E9|nr:MULTISPECIES: hypothetical protein [unclassified Cryobacterium]TFC59461.1 hypothetical protein E3O68_00750 [Cryobacterium sp. TMB3-1-2]TFC67257.1 hypothetical protein E3T21_17445 [Cryobacterium sp. TMB3-15]TFC73230.1 hypothetical protein E3T22_16610 [Cryobacterium sp. TMB3-10]TFD46118.1 hypothetical protein E3T58_01245 [Cryobacterium sp. TMB3-12]